MYLNHVLLQFHFSTETYKTASSVTNLKAILLYIVPLYLNSVEIRMTQVQTKTLSKNTTLSCEKAFYEMMS